MLNQNEFVSDLLNLVLELKVNKTTKGERVNQLIREFTSDMVEYGDSKGYISVDTLQTSDYSKTSSLLTVSEPTMDEQFLETTDRKKIAVSISKYLMKGAFTGENSLSEAIAVIESMLEKTKVIYTYKKIVKAFEDYVPAEATQTVTVTLNSEAGLSGADLEAVRRINAITLHSAMRNTSLAMQTPTRKYNDLAFEEMYDADDLIFLKNAEIETYINAYAFAELLNSDKLNDEKIYDKSILIPSEQFTGDQSKTIGWLCSKGKYQILPRFVIATSFQDGSNLMTNEWLHFWYISGFVNGLACVKFVIA